MIIIKKKKTTKSDLNLKLLEKYSVDFDKLDGCAIKEFKERIKSLHDSRQKGKKIYKIWDIVVICFLVILANCNDWEEIHEFAIAKRKWLRKFLMLSGGIPSAITIKRVFSIINNKDLEDIIVLFAQDVLKIFSSQRDILNIDGKTDNGSTRNENKIREKIKALNVLNVYSNNLDLCVASEKIEDKTNEITAIPTILDRINVKGNIITWDALNTQKTNIDKIVSLKGDLLFLLNLIKAIFIMI